MSQQKQVDFVIRRDPRSGRIPYDLPRISAYLRFAAKEGNESGYVGTKSATFKIVKGRELKQDDGYFRYVVSLIGADD